MKSIAPMIASWLLISMSMPADIASAGELQLTLPPMVYAVPGVPLSIYYDNVVLTQSPEAYRFRVECKLGSNEDRRWTVTPGKDDVGDHPLEMTVSDRDGKVLEHGRAMLRGRSGRRWRKELAAAADHR